MPEAKGKSVRRGRRRRAADRMQEGSSTKGPVHPGMVGGLYSPLSDDDQVRVDQTARDILIQVGMGQAPPFVVDLIKARGGKLDDRGRLRFPARLIEEAVAGLVRNFTLFGRAPGQDLVLAGARVHTGTGGAAPEMIDLATGNYRPSRLSDLFDAARIVDTLPHIHFFSRPLVARDMPDPASLDLNTAYASLAGTTKHVMTSISEAANVGMLAQLVDMIAGSHDAFKERPFLSLNINHAVPPLRFDAEACAVMRAAISQGIPVHMNTFGQLGASSPVMFSAGLAQTVAETLAGMVVAWLIDPFAKATFGPRPMVVDLRTGGLAGGSGEQALVTAAAVQMGKFYGFADSTIAGATDAKIGDAQSGYEKSLTITLAALAGSNLVTQAAGMHASLGACALESYVIDNDMLGSLLRPLAGIDTSGLSGDVEMIASTVESEGHFLGHSETFARMESDFVYPNIADRRPPMEWANDGGSGIRSVAVRQAKSLLDCKPVNCIGEDVDRAIRDLFDIRLRCCA